MPAEHDPAQPTDQPTGPAGPGDGDVDPTGVRELLAALPDPGPMPADLVRRIEARLDVERASLTQRAPAGQGQHTGDVVDLAAERSRRRPARTIALVGTAAAGLVAAAIVVPQLLDGPLGSGDSGVAAHYPARDRDEVAPADADGPADVTEDAAEADDAGDEDAAAGAADAEAEMASEEDAAAATGDSDVGAMAQQDASEGDTASSEVIELMPLGGELVLLPELGPVGQHDLDLTGRLLAALEEQQAQPQDGTERLRPGVLTEGEALSCWQELSTQHAFDRYAAARAQLVDGERPAQDTVALLGVDEDGTSRSWLMPERCTVDGSVEPLVEGVPQE